MRRLIVMLVVLPAMLYAGNRPDKQQKQVKDFVDQLFQISAVMLHDVVNPPAASRYYAYSTLAAYQVAQAYHPEMPDFTGHFNEKPDFSQLAAPAGTDPVFTATYAMLEVGKKMLPSGYMLQEKQEQYINRYQQEYGLSREATDLSIEYAEQVAEEVLAYAKTDGFSKLSTYTRYIPTQEEGRWYPTPPAYIEAIEPHWRTIRPFFLDSASQFAPPPPAPFDLDSGSSFHTQTMEVYHTVSNITDEEEEIANFWDCNPFAVKFTGHMAIGLKKITPGGHWMGIAGIASENAGISFAKAVEVHALLAMTLHDAFISCWDEKYRSDRIRPETVINRFIDQRWKPILQTPPFPEYTSGHSVASASAAVVLTALLGDNFAFDDDTEVLFGLPVRSFTSFYQAAEEAAISRLYGGIHFRDAIDDGVAEGKAVGNHILRRLSLSPDPGFSGR
jgi:hypothetical protein